MKHHVLTFLVACIAANPIFSAHSQSAADIAVGTAAVAPMDRAVSLPGTVEVRAGQDNSGISIGVSQASSRLAQGTGYFDTYALIASAPLKKDGSDPLLATLDGLANAATLEAKWARVIATELKSADASARDRFCEEAKAAFLRDNGKPAPENACDDAQWMKVNLSDERYPQYLGLFFGNSASVWIFGASAKIGYQEFTFYDPGSLSKQTDDNLPWAARAFVAWRPTPSPTLLTAAFEYQEAYKDAATNVVCPEGPPPLTCVNGPIGHPADSIKKLASLELRHRMTSLPVAMALTVTYDFEGDTAGIEVPIYFVANDKGALTGGIRMGWRDDTDDLTIGLFVGKAFSVLNVAR